MSAQEEGAVTEDAAVYRILVTKEDRGWKGTWYRVGQQFDCVAAKPPFALGWRPIDPDAPYGGINADDCIVLGRVIPTVKPRT